MTDHHANGAPTMLERAKMDNFRSLIVTTSRCVLCEWQLPWPEQVGNTSRTVP
jgi:hypothetical protein